MDGKIIRQSLETDAWAATKLHLVDSLTGTKNSGIRRAPIIQDLERLLEKLRREGGQTGPILRVAECNESLARGCREPGIPRITQDVIRDGSFTRVSDPSQAIIKYLADRNQNPRLYRSQAKGEEILAKIKWAREAQAKAAAAEAVHP